MYKSLEHIIREIKEGKCCCEKKKDSLENAIRKVQKKEYESSYGARDSKPVDEEENDKLPKDYDESIEEMNVVTNTGAEMTGRQFSTRPPIIAPRKDSDDGHGQSAKNVSVQRNKAIQKFSSKNVSDGGKISEDLINEAPGLPPLKLPMRITQPKVTQKPFAEPPPKIELPPVGPETPSTPVKAPTKTPTETPPKTPPVESPPKIEMPSKAPSVEAPPKIQTPTETPQKTPTVETPTKLKTPTEPLPKETPKTKIPDEPSTGGGNFPPALSPGKKGGIKLPGMGFSSAKPVELTGPHPPVKTSLGKHTHIRAIKNVYKEEVEGLKRKQIQDMPRKNAGDRHDIEYVGKKDADPKSTAEKISRQAQYKIKVIDEAKKLADVVKKVRKESGEGKTKVYNNIVINPDLNRIDNRDPQN